MNFKESLDAYRRGEATPEQARMVEDEIEKNKLINDYICGEMELNPPAPGPDTAGRPDRDSYKAVKKIMRRTLWKVGAIAAAIVLIALLAAQYIVSPLVASRYYNPAKSIENDIINGDSYPITQGELDNRVSNELSSFSDLLTSYVVDDLGYGKYRVQIGTYDLFDMEYTFEETTITRGKSNRQYWINTGTYYFTYYRGYTHIGKSYFNGPDRITDIPESAVVEAAVLYSEDHTVDQLLTDMGKNPDLFFEWAAVRNTRNMPTVGGDLAYIGLLGFRPVYIPVSDRIPSETISQYPYLFLPNPKFEKNTADILEQHFMSLLTYTCDREEEDQQLYQYDVNNFKYSQMTWHENSRKKIEEEGIQIYGAVVIGKLDDILALYQNGTINGIEIYDMKSSVYENEIY